MGKTIGVIQARMKSERLPGKILAPLGGRPLLAQLCARVCPARVDEWWLATTSDPADDVMEAWGFELGLRVFRGERRDLLSRFLMIGTEAGADWIVRVIADNPFLDASLIDMLIDALGGSDDAKRADVIELRGGILLGQESKACDGRSTMSPGLPLGYAAELIRRSALERADKEIPPDQSHHRLHVTSWLRTGQGRDETAICEVPTPDTWPNRPDWRWTVDTYEDLAMARSAFRVFGLEAAVIDYPTMVARLDAHPEISGMNQHIDRKSLEDG